MSHDSVTVTDHLGREYVGGSAVLCPGPWAKELLSLVHCHVPLTTVKIPVYYWR